MKDLDLSCLADAARSTVPVTGLTHNFYNYPARFSPIFASTAIEMFSREGDLVLDPFMGGGTSIVEALFAGRRTVGADINSLAVFITRVKTSPLTRDESDAVLDWSERTSLTLGYRHPTQDIREIISDPRTRNLHLPSARAIRKAIAIAIGSLSVLPTERSCDFVKCILLRSAQWALDSRKRTVNLSDFRQRILLNTKAMLSAIAALTDRLQMSASRCTLLKADARTLSEHSFFQEGNNKVDLVVTSPPYPGIHILYHRWQVDGRRETPAPYWITDCWDGQGEAFYTLGGRKVAKLAVYFEKLRDTFRSIRKVTKTGGYMVQMVSFADRSKHLRRYLYAMEAAGFREVKANRYHRIWRDVPSRKWHATMQGRTDASREVVLVHQAM